MIKRVILGKHSCLYDIQDVLSLTEIFINFKP